jgi:hypothetical protein
MSNSLATRAGSAAQSACSPCCTHGRNDLSSTPTFIAWLPTAGCPTTAPPGTPPGKPFCSRNRRLAALARVRFRNAFARVYQDVDLPRHVWRVRP